MFRNFIKTTMLVLALIAPSYKPSHAQTHVFPAQDTNNTFTGSNNFTGGLSRNGNPVAATVVYSGTGAPTDTCSSSVNVGIVEVNASPKYYQCNNSTGTYQWNQWGGATPGGTTNAIQGNDGSGGLTGGPATVDHVTGAINASVNTALNVQMYGAKGDCVTNDTAAITAAQTAATSSPYFVGNSGPAALFFPKPSGGCYIVSNFTWKGVPLIAPSVTGLPGASPYQPSVLLKGLPGQDILHIPDPTYTSGTIAMYAGWAIQNIGFMVDNSVAGSFPHRWPGRWFDDGAITSGSAVFTTTNGKITCGDVGQAIQVNGAGVAGANLVTTIASVSPCWIPSTQSGVTSWQVVTLAATASTTVSNAHTYISVLGLPVTENIGNCAIAFDMADGNRADWVGTTVGGNYGRMDNVTFAVTSGQSNDSCGVFTQGNPYFYGLRVDNFAFYGMKFAVVQTASELNSFQESNAGDFQLWQHGLFFQPWNPWISINGLSNKLKHIQYNTNSGVQIMQLGNNAFDAAIGWDIDLGGEAPGGATVYGHRIDGNDETITGDFAVNGTSEVGYADVNGSTITGDVNNTQLNGFGNTVVAPNITTGVIDNGYANVVTWIYNGGGSPNGMPLNYWVSGIFCKGRQSYLGCLSSDFVMDGNYTTPYNHDDLLIMPKDVVLNPVAGPYSSYIVNDAAAKSGKALIVNNTAPTAYYYQFMQYNELSNTVVSVVPGTNFPTTGGNFIFSARCPSGTSFTIYVSFSSTFTQTFSCTTSYAQYSIPMTFVAGDTGHSMQFGGGAGTNTFYVEWVAVVPRRDFPVGTTIGGNGVATGPSSGTAANDMVCYANTTGLMQDCNSTTTVNVTSAAGLTSTWKASAGSMSLALSAPSGSNTALQWYQGATRYWQMGLESTTAWVFRDYAAGKIIATFPENTMPANSFGGNSNGLTAITQATSDNSTNVATDAFVKAQQPKSTITVPATIVNANSCNTGTAVTITGITTSSVLAWPVPAASTNGTVTGFSSAGATLYFYIWPTANTYNWQICNNTAAGITPSSSTTWNVGVVSF